MLHQTRPAECYSTVCLTLSLTSVMNCSSNGHLASPTHFSSASSSHARSHSNSRSTSNSCSCDNIFVCITTGAVAPIFLGLSLSLFRPSIITLAPSRVDSKVIRSYFGEVDLHVPRLVFFPQLPFDPLHSLITSPTIQLSVSIWN